MSVRAAPAAVTDAGSNTKACSVCAAVIEGAEQRECVGGSGARDRMEADRVIKPQRQEPGHESSV